MKGHENDQRPGNHEHMQGEKSRQSRTGDDRPTQHELHERRASKWDAAYDRRSDSKSPIRVLIEAQHLSSECHAECHQQKKYTEDPGELPGKLVSTEQEDLRHVNQNNGHHEIRTPSVQGPDKPAESH